jgi:dTDP-4-dehydrorhamnose reductase
VEQVKQVVARLDADNISQSAQHRKVARPWGAYDSVDVGERHQVKRISNAAKHGHTLFSNSEQHGCPTFTEDVAERILLLIKERCSGIYNVVNEGNASRLEYVRAIVEAAGLTVPVESADAALFNRRAKVSSNEMAVNWRAQETGLPAMPCWRDSLRRYIRQQRTIT